MKISLINITILILLLISLNANAQIEEDWVINHSNQIWDSEIDSEGNLVTVFDEMGSSRVLKFSPQGDILWDKSSSSYLMSNLTVMIDNQDNIFLAGRKKDAALGDELTAIIVKIDSDGKFLWSKYLDVSTIPNFRNHNTVRDAELDSAGNVYLLNEVSYETGVQNEHYTAWYIYKCSPDGNFQWDYKHQGNVTNSQAYTFDFEVMPDGTIYAVGLKNQVNWPYSNEFAIIKLSASGSLQWERTFQDDDRGSGQFVTVNNNGTVLAGIYGGLNQFVRCYSSSGSQLWSKTYNSNTELYGISSLTTDHDGNFYVSGGKKSTSGVNNYIGVVLKYNAVTGERMRKYTLSYNYSGIAHSKIDSDNNLVLTGSTTFDGGSENGLLTTMFDEYGYEQWSHVYNSGNTDYGFSLNCGDSGITYVSGYNYEGGVGNTGQVIRYTIKKTIIPWTNSSGGMFSTATNWLGDEAPLEYQSALFDSMFINQTASIKKSSESNLTVTFDEITSNYGLFVGGSQILFDLQQHSFGLGTIEIGSHVPTAEESKLTITNGVVGVDVANSNKPVSIGLNGNGGMLVIDSNATLELTVAPSVGFSMVIGEDSCKSLDSILTVPQCANLIIKNGGKVFGGNVGVGIFSGTGNVLLNGKNTSWTEAKSITLGAFGDGTLTVNDNAIVSTDKLMLGLDENDNGVVLIDSDASLSADTIMVGINGFGVMTVADYSADSTNLGTTAIFGDVIKIGVEEKGYGTLFVINPKSSLLTVNGDMIVGDSGTGEFIINNGGFARFNELSLANSPGGVGTIEIEGIDSKCWVFDLITSTEGDSTTISVSKGAELQIDSTMLLGFSKEDAVTIMDVKGDGSLVTIGSDTLNNPSYSAHFGAADNTDLIISDSGSVVINAGAVLGLYESGSADILVEGERSSLKILDTIIVAEKGNSGVVIQDGSYFETGSVYIGRDSTSVGSVTIIGSSSDWFNYGNIVVGNNGIGLVTLRDGATLLNQSGTIVIGERGSFNSSGGSFTTQSFLCGVGGTFIDSTGTIFIGGAPVLVSQKSGQIKATAAGESYVDTLLIAEGAVLDVNSIVLNEGGYLGVGGAYSFPVTNSGGFNPGGLLGETGDAILDTDYTQTIDGTLYIELSDSTEGGYDRLVVNGTASLAGSLQVSLVNGFSPDIGTVFEVLTADSIDGTFESVVGYDGLTLSVQYTDSSVQLTVNAFTDIIDIDNEILPEYFSLHQNYPNPFNPTTSISFDVPKASDVRLEIYNILGQQVATLANGKFRAGFHSIRWDASELASGMYLYKVTTDEFSDVRKMLLLK